MTLRAALFDLDGTLLDTLEDLADSMNRALASLGFPAHPIKAYRYFVGDGLEAMATRALPQDQRDQNTVARAVAGMRRRYSRKWAEKTRPYDGVPEMLNDLTVRRVPMAVLSNKPDELTRLTVAELLPHWRFEAVRGLREDGRRKPDPAGAMEIANLIGVPPEQFAYVGDTNTDMKTAQAAGMYAVGALWGFREAAELTESGAQTLLAHPMDVVGLLVGAG